MWSSSVQYRKNLLKRASSELLEEIFIKPSFTRPDSCEGFGAHVSQNAFEAFLPNNIHEGAFDQRPGMKFQIHSRIIALIITSMEIFEDEDKLSGTLFVSRTIHSNYTIS